jgi:hypothetical protein
MSVELCRAQDPYRPAVGPCLKDKGHPENVHEGWHAGGNRTQWRAEVEVPTLDEIRAGDSSLRTVYHAVDSPPPVPEYEFDKVIDLPPQSTQFALAHNAVIAAEAEPTFQEVFRGIFDETFDLLVERQKKYGPDNIAQQGLFGVFGRISNDKIQRLKRSLNGVVYNGDIVLDAIEDFEDESFEDSLKDVANYALIMLALHRGVWGAPLE